MHRRTVSIVGAIIVVGGLFAFAGDLNPPKGPIEPTMHTLDEIYVAVTQPQCCAPSPVPSHIVSARIVVPDSGLWQVPIPLEEGEVFILTAWTAYADVSGFPMLQLREGNSGDDTTIRDRLGGVTGTSVGQHVFPTGIRFPRATNGMADIYAQNASGVGFLRIVVHGYITDDL